MNEVKLGQLPGPEAQRDAVRVAVAPCVAGELLEPGRRVGLHDGRAYWSLPDDGKIGVVDPFLAGPVEPGQCFWLCLYPGTITGMRHMWSHPAFAVPADAR